MTDNSKIQRSTSGKTSDKNVMALDALSKLARQFSDKPDFKKLISTLLLTISGQLSVTDMFSILRKPGIHEDDVVYVAIGRSMNNPLLKSLKLSGGIENYFLSNGSARRVSDLHIKDFNREFDVTLKNCRMEMVCPIIHNERLIGVVGLGERIGKKPFEEKDVELFNIFVNTVTPLIASSYHFWEVSHLNSWYLDILNNVKQGVFVFDCDYKLKKINRAGFNILKTFMPHLALSATLHKMQMREIFREDVFINWSAKFEEAISESRSNLVVNLIAQKGNIKCIYDAYLRRISEDKDSEDDFIVSLDDITERKLAEIHERKLQEQLERAQRMESLGILAGGVAHDLNNMLGPLVGYPELMLMKLPDDSPLKKQIEIMGRSAKDAADIVQDLLTLARRGRYEMVPTDINEVIKNYIDSPSFTSLAESHPNVTTRLDLDEKIGNIKGSAPHLAKVLMNLIINAYDAMPEGGELDIQTSREFIATLPSGYSDFESGNYVVISVRDTGTGIDPKDIDRIFEPYYSKKKMGSSGSGLGLAIIYGIIKDHKGYYDINSIVGQGTEFLIYFPQSAENDTAKEAKKECCGDEKVLVVDDVEEQREMASELLGSFGYKVDTVCNGREAIEYLKKHSVNIVVIDMIMEKDFDGLDTYQEIIKIRPGQKAVIISGFSATARVAVMQQLGAGKYIKKPFSRDKIGQAVREELDREPALDCV